MPLQAILFDVDGVLMDVSASYDAAIIATAKEFGVDVTAEQIAELHKKPNTNNDWHVTYMLVKNVDVVDLDDPLYKKIYEKFEQLFRSDNFNGLILKEKRVITTETLDALKSYKLGIVTSRPRDVFMHSLQDLIPTYFQEDYIITLDDCDEEKPSPKPVLLALERMGVLPENAIFLGDTENDREAASAAGVPYLQVPDNLVTVNELPIFLTKTKNP